MADKQSQKYVVLTNTNVLIVHLQSGGQRMPQHYKEFDWRCHKNVQLKLSKLERLTALFAQKTPLGTCKKFIFEEHTEKLK